MPENRECRPQTSRWPYIVFGALLALVVAILLFACRCHAAVTADVQPFRATGPDRIDNGHECRIQAGSTYHDGSGWQVYGDDLDSVDADTWTASRRAQIVDVKPDGIIAIRSRHGWWSMGLQAVLSRGQWNHRPHVAHGRAWWTPAPGESIGVRCFPEGIELTRTFVDSARLATYGGVIVYRLTKSGLGHGKHGNRSMQFDSVSFSNPLATNDRGDTLWGDVDTLKLAGKLYLREIFNPDSLARLSRGGTVVTIDPTATIQPSATTNNDGTIVHTWANSQNDTSAYLATLLWVGNSGLHVWRSFVKFTGLPRGHYISVVLTLRLQVLGGAGGNTDWIVQVVGQDAGFVFPTGTGGFVTTAGVPSWLFCHNRTSPWYADTGCAVRGHIGKMVTVASNTFHSISLFPPALVERWGAAFEIRRDLEAGGSMQDEFVSGEGTTVAQRPFLTINYVPYAGADDLMAGGVSQ